MSATGGHIVTVFGGTGFLGRCIVRHLRSGGFSVRIAARHPAPGYRPSGHDDPQLHWVRADIREERSVADALSGAYGAVNAVSLYVERGPDTFHSVHVEAAQRVAAQARRAGVARFIQLSGIGADAASRSRYIRKRGEGELAVRAAFAEATIVRPAVMFGPDDAFLTTLLELLRRLPVYPMFGHGLTRLQPAYVEDVADAIGRILQRPETSSRIFEFGGPRIYSYEELLKAVARQAGLAPRLIPVPFAAWYALAFASEWLPNPRLTRNQVELMQIDTVPSPDLPGFAELEISPRSIEAILQEMMAPEFIASRE